MASPGYRYDGERFGLGESFGASGSYSGGTPGAGMLQDNMPRILLMGLRRSGKSSIQKVVFHKMAPNETLFLEATTHITKNEVSHSSFVQFQIWDFPGQIDLFNDDSIDYETLFESCGALIFVIDSQDDYSQALLKLQQTVAKAFEINPNITFEGFIHKVDGLNDDDKLDVLRSIQRQSQDDLVDAGFSDVHITFYLTSIYDHSIFEAFSKVIQKLIPQLPTLENLLDNLVANCKMEKAFLVDVVSKIYVATDSSFVDMQMYELASDMIDVVLDVSCIYGRGGDSSPLAYDEKSQSQIKLSNGMVLYLREVNQYLALVAQLREESFQKQGLIDYNFSCFHKAINEVFAKKI